MSGLRERQKKARRAMISDAAMLVFGTKGFEATTIDQIADQAGVSPPTITNYFPGGKQEILVSLLRMPEERIVAAQRDALTEIEDPLEAFCELSRLVAESQLKTMPSALWREIGPILLSSELTHVLQPWHETIITHAECMLDHFKGRGLLKSGLDTLFTATFINDCLSVAFLRLVTSEKPDLASYGNHVRRALEIVFNGLTAK